MSKAEIAISRFKEGALCSQSVFTAFSEELGLDRETASKIATPFGGGMSLMGEVCGAVTGALMAIGLKHGNQSNWRAEDSQKEKTYAVSASFVQEFRKRNGSIKCRDLLKLDISTPEGRQAAREGNLYIKLCPKYVRDAAEILEKLC